MQMRLSSREGISIQSTTHVPAIVRRRAFHQTSWHLALQSHPALTTHHTNTMVVAEFTDADDTHPRVVAGTAPAGEESTNTTSTTSIDAGKTASGEFMSGYATGPSSLTVCAKQTSRTRLNHPLRPLPRTPRTRLNHQLRPAPRTSRRRSTPQLPTSPPRPSRRLPTSRRRLKLRLLTTLARISQVCGSLS